jgi:hypothetical protein
MPTLLAITSRICYISVDSRRNQLTRSAEKREEKQGPKRKVRVERMISQPHVVGKHFLNMIDIMLIYVLGRHLVLFVVRTYIDKS